MLRLANEKKKKIASLVFVVTLKVGGELSFSSLLLLVAVPSYVE